MLESNREEKENDKDPVELQNVMACHMCAPRTLTYTIPHGGIFSRVAIFADVGFLSFLCSRIGKATSPNFTNLRRTDLLYLIVSWCNCWRRYFPWKRISGVRKSRLLLPCKFFNRAMSRSNFTCMRIACVRTVQCHVTAKHVHDVNRALASWLAGAWRRAMAGLRKKKSR